MNDMNERTAESIERFMIRDLELVSEETSAVIAAGRMAARRIGCVLVQAEDRQPDHPRVVGLVSETDLVRNVMAQGRAGASITVAQIMASPLESIPSDRSMLDANHLMEQLGVPTPLRVRGGEDRRSYLRPRHRKTFRLYRIRASS